MAVRRRISATFKDIPGGGARPTFDYTHRLLDYLPPIHHGRSRMLPKQLNCPPDMPRVTEFLNQEDLIETDEPGRSRRSVGNAGSNPGAD